MILPGTYITVLDEGLISVGAISVGNVGIVGTAKQGDAGRVYTLSSFSGAREVFGPPTTPETLVRSLELLFGNGASTVYAVRAADEGVEAHAQGLALLENQLVNIVLLAGQD